MNDIDKKILKIPLENWVNSTKSSVTITYELKNYFKVSFNEEKLSFERKIKIKKKLKFNWKKVIKEKMIFIILMKMKNFIFIQKFKI